MTAKMAKNYIQFANSSNNDIIPTDLDFKHRLSAANWVEYDNDNHNLRLIAIVDYANKEAKVDLLKRHNDNMQRELLSISDTKQEKVVTIPNSYPHPNHDENDVWVTIVYKDFKNEFSHPLEFKYQLSKLNDKATALGNVPIKLALLPIENK